MQISAYAVKDGQLRSIDPECDLSTAIWIDLYMPGRADYDRIKELGIEIPRLRDVEQIEPSQRLRRVDDTDMITVQLTEPRDDTVDCFDPVSFLITPERLVTVRYHGPDLWLGFTLINRNTPGDILVALLSLGVGHMADLIESWDRQLDRVSHEVFESETQANPARLRTVIRSAGSMGEDLSYVRLNLLIMRRAVAHLEEIRADGRAQMTRKQGLKRLDRDLESLTIHTDYLGGRVTLAIDATVGLISLAQNDNARIYSVVATIFLPATLIASIFGMNFDRMPMLNWTFGFEVSLIQMGIAAIGILAIFILRRWL